MSEDNTTTEETITTEESTATEEAPIEVEPKAEVAEEKPSEPAPDVGDKFDEVSGSVGTGKQVFSGACKLCGARIASGVVNKDGKVHCMTCNGDF